MLNKIEVLGSSSSGNAYVLSFDKGIIQLDAGVKNLNHNKVNHLFISHQKHTDHDKYLKDFTNNNIILPQEKERVSVSPELSWESFFVPHKVLNNGYIIEYDNEKIGYITDCGDCSKIDRDLSGLTYLFVECNWDYFLIKNGIIHSEKYSAYAFSKQGHMSNLDCLTSLARWKVNKDCKIIFIHKSSHHANYETTYKMFESLPNKTAIAKKGDTIYCKSWKII